MEHHGVPVEGLISHAVNLGIFLSIVIWALVSKMKVGDSISARRREIETQVEKAQAEIDQARKDLEQSSTSIASFDAEARNVMGQAESRAKMVASQLIADAEAMAKRIAEESRQTTQQELARLKESVAEELIEEVVEEAARRLQQGLGTKDEALIRSHAQKVEMN